VSVSLSFAGGENGRILKTDCWKALSGTRDWYEQKVKIYPDGKFEYYPLITDAEPIREGYFIAIAETWVDSEGIIWYNTKRTIFYVLYDLGTVGESGKKCEFISNPDTYPTEWDTSVSRYPKCYHYI
jgi:hypothetical protein